MDDENELNELMRAALPERKTPKALADRLNSPTLPALAEHDANEVLRAATGNRKVDRVGQLDRARAELNTLPSET